MSRKQRGFESMERLLAFIVLAFIGVVVAKLLGVW